MSQKGAKSEYMTGPGSLAYGEMGHRLFDIIEQAEPHMLEESQCCEGNFTAMFYVSRQLGVRAHKFKYHAEQIGFTQEDAEEIDHAISLGAEIYNQGIDNPEFPFHFIPALLTDALRASQERLGLSDDELDSLTLTDFAHLLRAEWFKNMLTGTAFTSNGRWENVGRMSEEYHRGRHPVHRVTGLENPEELYEVLANEEGSVHIDLSVALKKALTRTLRDSDSVGCPVAAKHRIIDNPENPHAKYLVANGHMTLQERGNDIVGIQTQTPVERSAVVLADYLDKYVEKYGEPRDH